MTRLPRKRRRERRRTPSALTEALAAWDLLDAAGRDEVAEAVRPIVVRFARACSANTDEEITSMLEIVLAGCRAELAARA